MDEVASIAELIARGDDSAAFARLRARLGWPHGRELDESDLPRYLELLGDLASRRDGQVLADLASAVREDPDSPDRLYDLGYALIDAGAPGIAASLLWRCLRLVGDSEEVVCELVSALESALAYRDAFGILEDHAPLRARSFLCRYLYAFNAAMAGKLDVTRAALPELAPDTPETEVMRDAIAAMVARADRVGDALPLDDRDLRGWHYVLTGGLVIHQSPYGFDDPMRGRYAWLADSLDRIATGIARLQPLIDEVDVECVYAAPGRDHEIVARAVSVKLGIPMAEWPVIGSPAPGLVVAYDLAKLDPADVQRLAHRRPGQILFAHAAPWTHDSPIAPDVTMLLYQSLVAPWSKQGDDVDIDEVVADLVVAKGLEEVDLAADEPARWAELVARAWPPVPGMRSRLWAGGPVPSNRFE